MSNLQPSMDVADVRRGSKALRGVFLLAVIALLASFAGKHVVWPLVRLVGGAKHGDPAADVVRDIGVNLTEALPAVCLLVGVVAAYQVFHRMSDGEIFSAANTRGFGRIGHSMIWAAVSAIVISPSLAGWIRGDTTIDFSFEDWALGVGVLGLAFLLIRRVLALAARIQAENDEIV